MKSIQNDAPTTKKQLRYRKKERTKEEILAIAKKFYCEKPINEVLLEDIAEAAFVSRTTIYNYFKNKDDVLFAVGNKVFSELNETITRTLPNKLPGKEQVLFLCAKTFKDGTDNPIIMKILRDTFNHIKNKNLTPESIQDPIVKKIGQSTFNNFVEGLSPLEDFEFETKREGKSMQIIISKCPWHNLMLKSGREHLSEKVSDLICHVENSVWASEFGKIAFKREERICRGDGICLMRFEEKIENASEENENI